MQFVKVYNKGPLSRQNLGRNGHIQYVVKAILYTKTLWRCMYLAFISTPSFSVPVMEPPTLAELVKEVDISPHLLDQKCSDAHIASISQFLGWRTVAPHLGLNKTDISDIESKKTEPEKRVETLQKWRKKLGFKAKLKLLVETLLNTGNAEDAEKVCRLLKQQAQGTHV